MVRCWSWTTANGHERIQNEAIRQKHRLGSLKHWLRRFITAAFIWTHDIKLEIRAINEEDTTLLYTMLVYNALREDWIQENDVGVYDRPHVYVFVPDKKMSTLESVFKNFRIRSENTLDKCGRKPYS